MPFSMLQWECSVCGEIAYSNPNERPGGWLVVEVGLPENKYPDIEGGYFSTMKGEFDKDECVHKWMQNNFGLELVEDDSPYYDVISPGEYPTGTAVPKRAAD